MIGIAALQWDIPYRAYTVTALLYGITLIITAAFQGMGILKSRIRSLLLAPYQAERKGRGYQWLKKLFPNYARNHLLEFSLLARHKKNWAVRYGFSALLVGSVLYLVSFCTVFQFFLQETNGLTPEEQWYFRAVSKIERFELSNQSGQFIIFLLCFVEMLLLMAAYLLIYSGIAAEQEENRRLMRSLSLIYKTGESVYHSGKLGCLAEILAAVVLIILTMKFTVSYTERGYL